MKSKHVCPNCGGTKFITVAHVSQDWLVDENGCFIKEMETTEVIAEPNDDNTWICYSCGIEAIVTN